MEVGFERIKLSPGRMRSGVGQGIIGECVADIERSILSAAGEFLKVLVGNEIQKRRNQSLTLQASIAGLKLA